MMGRAIAAIVLFISVLWSATTSAQSTLDESSDVIQTAVREDRYLDAYGEIFRLRDSEAGALETMSQMLSRAIVQLEHRAPRPGIDEELVTRRSARALIEWFGGDYQAARTDASTVLELEPQNTFAQVIQAGAQAALGTPEEAGGQFAEAAAAASGDAQLLGLVAAMQFDLFAIEGMLERSNEAIELAPDLAHAYRLRGLAERFAGDLEAAIADADRALELAPDYYGFYIFRATLHAASGEFEAALAHLSTAIALNPGTSIGLGMRANIYMALGQPDLAAEDFAAAIAITTVEDVSVDPLTPGIPARLTMTQGRTYHVPFQAQAGQQVSVEVTSVNPEEVDPVALIVGPDDAPLAFSDDASEQTLDSLIADYVIADAGEYVLVVSHANAGSEGDVDVLLTAN